MRFGESHSQIRYVLQILQGGPSACSASRIRHASCRGVRLARMMNPQAVSRQREMQFDARTKRPGSQHAVVTGSNHHGMDQKIVRNDQDASFAAPSTGRVTLNNPLVIASPRIGFLNLLGSSAQAILEEDKASFASLFARSEENHNDAPTLA